MTSPTNDIKFNVKNGLAVGASGFPVINTAGEWVGASGAGESPYGATGARGAEGEKGDVGIDGASGPTGEQGSQGQTGIRGADGDQGQTGLDGATGVDGQQGYDGATGVTGQDGAQGDDGAQGPDGPEGPQGEDGLQGATGGNGGYIGGGLTFDPAYTPSGNINLLNENTTAELNNAGYYSTLGTTAIGPTDKVVFGFYNSYDGGEDYLNRVGLSTHYAVLTNDALGGADDNSVGLGQQGYYYFNDSATSTDWNLDNPNWVQGDYIDVAVDMVAKKFWVRVNGGNWNNNGSANPATNTGGYTIDQNIIDNGPVYPAITLASFNYIQTYDFQQTAQYAVPSGFTFLGAGSGVAANQGVQGASGPTGETGATGPAGARYHTTSTTTLNLTTGATGLVCVDDYLNYSAGQVILISDGGGKHIHATVDSYDPVTKTLNFTPTDHVGTGSASSWEINLDGAEGVVGASGVTGRDGATGVIGSTGPQGFFGLRGATGADGEQGSEGPGGATGVAGATGSLGETGIDGDQGTVGLDGDQGQRGVTGDQGQQGIDGDQGYQGVDGATGNVGATGMQGGNGSIGAGVYGDGNSVPTVTYSAPANSVSLGFITTDDHHNSDSNLYFDGFNGLYQQTNGGADYWEYVSLAYKNNSTAVNNVTATVNSWETGNGQYWIGMVETLKGVSSVPYNDDFWGSQESNNNYSSVGFGAPNNSIAILIAGTEAPGAKITSINDTGGLTWYKRSDITAPGTHSADQSAEVWYAINNTGSFVNTTITVNYDNSFDDQAMIVSTWMGVDLADPWDGSGSGPTNTGYTGSTGATGAKGPDGNQGYDGASGVTGQDGATGPGGATGTTGDQGQVGQDGATGIQGPTGPDGQQGVVGYDAATGPTGEDGAQGYPGATGVQGSSGPTGDTGDYGATGWYGHRFRAVIQSGGYVIGDTGSGDIYLQVDSQTGDYSYGFAAGQTIIIYKDADNYATALVSSYDNNTGDLYVTIVTTVGSSDPGDTLYTNLDGAVGVQGATGVTGQDGATGPTGATGAQGGNGGTYTSINAHVTYQLDNAWLEYPTLMGSYLRVQGPLAGITAGMTVTYGGHTYTVYNYIEFNNEYSMLEFTDYPITIGAIPAGADIVIEGFGPGTNVGVTGDDGATGVQGASGVTGDQGQTGPDGAQGIDGEVGYDGATGVTGATGSQGETGATGVDGATGFSLVTGSTGIAGTSQTTVNIFAANMVGTDKYLVQGVNGSNVQATEVILTQNASGVYITEYATLRTGSKVMDVTATTNGSVVSLKVTPTTAGTTVSWVRESVQGRIGGTTVDDPSGLNLYYAYSHSDNGLIPSGKSYVYPGSYWTNLINFTSLVGTEVTFDAAGVGPQNPAVGTIDSWDGTTLVVTIVSGNFTSRTDLDKITYGY